MGKAELLFKYNASHGKKIQICINNNRIRYMSIKVMSRFKGREIGHQTASTAITSGSTLFISASIPPFSVIIDIGQEPHAPLGYRTPHEVYFGDGRNNDGQADELIHLIEGNFLS